MIKTALLVSAVLVFLAPSIVPRPETAVPPAIQAEPAVVRAPEADFMSKTEPFAYVANPIAWSWELDKNHYKPVAKRKRVYRKRRVYKRRKHHWLDVA